MSFLPTFRRWKAPNASWSEQSARLTAPSRSRMSSRGLSLAEGVEGVVHRELPLELLVVIGRDGGKPAGDRLESVPLRHLVGCCRLARVGVVDDLADHVERRIL